MILLLAPGQVRELARRARTRRGDDSIDERGNGLLVAGHPDFRVVRRPVPVAEQAGQLSTHAQDAVEHGDVLGRADVVGGDEHPAPQILVLRVHQHRPRVHGVRGQGHHTRGVRPVARDEVRREPIELRGRDPGDLLRAVADISRELGHRMRQLVPQFLDLRACTLRLVHAGSREVTELTLHVIASGRVGTAKIDRLQRRIDIRTQRNLVEK